LIYLSCTLKALYTTIDTTCTEVYFQIACNVTWWTLLLRWLVASFSPQRHRLNPRLLHVGFMVRTAIEQIVLWILQFLPVGIFLSVPQIYIWFMSLTLYNLNTWQSD